ncbi:MAG: membrane protein insertion efficiency factor YidD [Alphaproteobacteria bacterium]|nr:membrane protein insertion efficiency factor YidD [Alphaproteobacteria bacterium]
MSRLSAPIRLPLLGLIWLYQHSLGLMLRPACRFYPSCSCYAAQALRQLPLGRALWLIGRRLLRCHPLHPGGIDLVPELCHNDTSTCSPAVTHPPIPNP